MSSSSPPRRQGRPPDRDKQAKVLNAAQQLFLSNGFSGTSMDAIADAAGVSKLTAYKHFGSKQHLFAQSVAQRCEAVLGGIDHSTFAMMGPRDGLVAFGKAFLALILDPQAMAVHRVIVAERERAPELGRLFFENAVQPTMLKLQEVVAGQIMAGYLPQNLDPVIAAQDLLALWRGRPFLLSELGIEEFDQNTIASHVEHGVDLCLKAWKTASHVLDQGNTNISPAPRS